MERIDNQASQKEQKMERIEVKEANEIIGKQYKVLDHGFIALVDYMGNDSSIVQAARVSYGAGTKSIRDDSGLIRYLMRHEHTTPFEMVEFKFLARMPIFAARQWVRHRTASINEYSARYSIVKDEYYVPELAQIQAQSTTNRQGREAGKLSAETQEATAKDIKAFSGKAYALYSDLIERGVARELARMVLPLNFYTEWYWKSNLHNTFHFLSLRLDPHAQWEIRQYAVKMGEIVKSVVPVAYAAFEDFTLNGVRLSSKEQAAVGMILKGSSVEEACSSAKLMLRKEDGKPVKTGEGPEFIEKLAKITEKAKSLG
ncbi:FAD-dependent thymidylate synthase [Candidatus Marsarchaeota archaeon]|nr:FAD-dependent thymidylate synthase [Candidatus Marsarchaeota archaeon]MCL5404627.1 FAD-dependent thymidylate synthase [Candidatus Marsarchaeota archaeon]